jgi:hypothetical protein
MSAKRKLVESVLKHLGVLEPRDKLVRVINWMPQISDGDLVWPLMIKDRYGYARCLSWPVWDKRRFQLLFFGETTP